MECRKGKTGDCEADICFSCGINVKRPVESDEKRKSGRLRI